MIKERVTATVLMVAACFSVSGCTQDQAPDIAYTMIEEPFGEDGSTVHFAKEDPFAEEIVSTMTDARETVEAFWGRPFPEPVKAILSPDRAHFNTLFPPEWGIGKTQCWMVGVGVADFLAVLSPSIWGVEDCGHDGEDKLHIRDIFVHELAHVYHGQNNPTRDFTGAEEIGWFAEGIGVLVAGQLERDKLSSPQEAIRNGAAPKKLKKAWSGQYRYGVSGSIVAYIDAEYGRDVLFELLSVTSEDELLSRLNTSEAALLDAWESWVLSASSNK
ncbi:MAG: hypothetical protein DHS20C05_21650 [Hyphococcus sp.]|nr:MAG: hypothetical protein DHS20C05_21650 [Marinicaulis sp.]